MIIQSIEIDVTALQLLPETNPIVAADVQLRCFATEKNFCVGKFASCGFTCEATQG